MRGKNIVKVMCEIYLPMPLAQATAAAAAAAAAAATATVGVEDRGTAYKVFPGT